MTEINFAARFLKLTLVGFVLAIFAVGGAVWFASQPILSEMQREARQAHLATKANIINRFLDDFLYEGRYRAQSTALQAYVLGEEDLEAQLRNDLAQFQNVRNIRLLDFDGRELLSPPVSAGPSRFFPVEAQSGLADMIAGRTTRDPIVRYRPGTGLHDAAFLIGIPVVNQGFVEGVLSFELDTDLSDLLSANEEVWQTQVLTQFQMSQWMSWNPDRTDLVAVPMPGADFFLVSDADTAAVATRGRELVTLSISVAIVALLIPFASLGISGQRAIVRPHRDLQKSQAQLSEKTERLAELASVAEMATESVIISNADGHAIWVNRAFTAMTGFAADEILGRTPGHLLQGPDTNPETVAEIGRKLRSGDHVQCEILNYSKSGRPFWVNLSISPIPGQNGGDIRYASIATDITEIKKAHREIAEEKRRTEYQALHDPLTGLPNRRYVDSILDEKVTNSTEPRTLVHVDLDHFKHVNDTLGHAAGDYVLSRVADILRNHLGAGDIAARVGGDEFVLLLEQGTSEAAAFKLTEALRLAIRQDMIFEGNTCRIGASFGISSSDEDHVNNDNLLKCADSALYLAKEAGRNKTVLYTPAVHEKVLERRDLSADIERALENKEFIGYFQPQFEANSEVMIGVETLARWQHPERGILAPPAFMETAEKLKVVPDIDNQVFGYGLDSIAALNREELFIPKIAFNVGVIQLMNPDLVRIAREKDVGFTHIALEVLESVLIEGQDQRFMDRVTDLRRNDFSIEVDDFGSGHASIISLQRLKPNFMKIDRELIKPMTQSEQARDLVKCIIEMGRTLDIQVIAEGVETAEHARVLRDLGCDAYQGYYFAYPMPFEELRDLLRQGFDQARARPFVPKANGT